MKIIIVALILLIITAGAYFFLFKGKAAPSKSSKIMSEEIKMEIPQKRQEKVSITTIYDNYSADPRLETGWGFSALIKFEGRNILFDTGADSVTLLANMEKMEINPKTIDFVFISHLHDDHTGGLSGILKIKPDLKVYHPASFTDFAEITKGIYTTGPLGASPKEQSLILKSNQGLVIITGCAHPGPVNIVKKVKEMFPEESVYLVLGGFHLEEASDFELESVIDDFKKLGVQKVAPCHCSGERCRELFKKEYGKNYLENGVGKVIEI